MATRKNKRRSEFGRRLFDAREHAGAVLGAVRAQWKLPASTIEFMGITGRADAGELVIGTPAGIERFREEQRRATGARSTPM